MHGFDLLLFYVEQLSYVGVTAALIVGGYILPIPEEAILILLGYFLRAGAFMPIPLFLVALLGVTLHDNALYVLARRGSKYTSFVLEKMRQSPFLRTQLLDEAHIWKALVLFRFVPYLRIGGPILAGSMHMPWKKFFVINILVLGVYVFVTLSIGYLFHGALELVLQRVSEIEHVVVLVLFSITGLIVAWYMSHVFGFFKR